MPGPVSDSYDPEFGTGANAHDVREGIRSVIKKIDKTLGSTRLDIVTLCQRPDSDSGLGREFFERDLRIIRFALDRAAESL